jgi:hypothetical protein
LVWNICLLTCSNPIAHRYFKWFKWSTLYPWRPQPRNSSMPAQPQDQRLDLRFHFITASLLRGNFPKRSKSKDIEPQM